MSKAMEARLCASFRPACGSRAGCLILLGGCETILRAYECPGFGLARVDFCQVKDLSGQSLDFGFELVLVCCKLLDIAHQLVPVRPSHVLWCWCFGCCLSCLW
jgi:hypothetical protein